MGGEILDKQCTLGEASSCSAVRVPGKTERKILVLVGEKCCQADIARKLGISRAYVNQVIKKHEGVRLKRVPTQKGNHTIFYELSQQLKGILQGELTTSEYSSCRVHNLRKKFKWSSDKSVSIDDRTGYQKQWMMRGGARYKYWYPGKAGLPSVTIDAHPRTLVVYVDKKQFIAAPTPKEAEEIGWRAVYAAVDSFAKLQERFGIKVDVSHTGEVIGKPHGGFVGKDSPVMKEGVTLDRWWIDKSVESEVGPDKVELETDDPHGMTRLDSLIKLSENPMDMFKSVTDPLNANILQVQAMLQGGITISQQYEQMVNFMTKALDEMAAIRRENAELKARLGI